MYFIQTCHSKHFCLSFFEFLESICRDIHFVLVKYMIMYNFDIFIGINYSSAGLSSGVRTFPELPHPGRLCTSCCALVYLFVGLQNNVKAVVE